MANVTLSSDELAALAALVAPLAAPQVAAILAGAQLPPVVVTPPPVVTDPAVQWILKDATFTGAGDYSYGTGNVVYGPNGATVNGDEGWQPRFPNDDLLLTAGFLLVSINPAELSSWTTGMLAVGDKAIPGSTNAFDISQYCTSGPIKAGQWNDFKIPLSRYGKLPFHAYKVMFLAQGEASPKTNVQQYNRLGISPT